MMRVLAKEKRHLRDMQRAMMEMQELDAEDSAIAFNLKLEGEEVEEVVGEALEGVEEADKVLAESLTMEEIHEKEEKDAELIGRFRVVHEKVRKQNTVVDIMLKRREETTTKEQRWEKYVGKKERMEAGDVKRINVSDLRRGARRSISKKRGRRGSSGLT